MFELAGLSAFLDIFQKAFGLIEKRRDQKRRLFEEIIEPIYTQLSLAVGEYYEFFRGCRDDFSQTEFKNWQTILNEKRKKREEIVLARNTVLGMMSPFLSEQRERKGKEDELLYSFARSIEDFFFASDNLPRRSLATSLFGYIDRVVEKGDVGAEELVIKAIGGVLLHLELEWRGVSDAYGELRVYCLS